VASRVAFRLARPAKKSAPLDEAVGEPEKGDLELAYLKKRYGEPFKEAFKEALGALPVNERLLLKQRYALQMTVVELGAQHGVHASTISRWVAEARDRLVRGTRDSMMRRLSLDRAEVSSILRLIQSQMDVSLSTVRESGAHDVSR
jgi:RNA polymerase sigma-70 factor (ECF subfamily)